MGRTFTNLHMRKPVDQNSDGSSSGTNSTPTSTSTTSTTAADTLCGGNRSILWEIELRTVEYGAINELLNDAHPCGRCLRSYEARNRTEVVAEKLKRNRELKAKDRKIKARMRKEASRAAVTAAKVDPFFTEGIEDGEADSNGDGTVPTTTATTTPVTAPEVTEPVVQSTELAPIPPPLPVDLEDSSLTNYVGDGTEVEEIDPVDELFS